MCSAHMVRLSPSKDKHKHKDIQMSGVESKQSSSCVLLNDAIKAHHHHGCWHITTPQPNTLAAYLHPAVCRGAEARFIPGNP